MKNCTYISIALLLNDMHIFEECIRSSLGSSCLRWSLSPTSVSFRLHPIPRLVFSSLWEKKNCSLGFILWPLLINEMASWPATAQFPLISQLFRAPLLTQHIWYPQWITGFPGGTNGKEPSCQCRRHKRHGFDPWVRKILWKRKWQPTPVFLPGESLGQRSLASYIP